MYISTSYLYAEIQNESQENERRKNGRFSEHIWRPNVWRDWFSFELILMFNVLFNY